MKLAPGTLQMFVGYPWEGNNREIENVIERIVITVDDVVTVEDLPLSMQEAAVEQSGQSLYKMLEEVERNIILKAYKTYGSSYKVAEFLQISQSAATRKIKKFIEGKKTLDKKATFVSIDKKAMYINGEWITLQEQIEVNNPATKEIFATVPKGGVTEAKQAVDAAHEAFKTWSKLTQQIVQRS